MLPNGVWKKSILVCIVVKPTQLITEDIIIITYLILQCNIITINQVTPKQGKKKKTLLQERKKLKW